MRCWVDCQNANSKNQIVAAVLKLADLNEQIRDLDSEDDQARLQHLNDELDAQV